MSYILDLLYFKQKDKEREKSVAIFDRVPFLEFITPGFPTGLIKFLALARYMSLSSTLI